MRSLLLVAADSDAALHRALASGADVVVIDIADAAPANRPGVRRRAAAFTAANRQTVRLFVRVAPLSSGDIVGDLDAIVPAHPHGIVLPKSMGGTDVTRLSAMLRPREARAGIADGAIAIVAMAADTPAGLFGLGTYRGATRRLVGIAWDANALAKELGCATDAGPARLARALVPAAAAAAGVAAIDSPGAATDDQPGSNQAADQAAADGFTGKFTRQPDAVAGINRAFAAAASNR